MVIVDQRVSLIKKQNIISDVEILFYITSCLCNFLKPPPKKKKKVGHIKNIGGRDF